MPNTADGLALGGAFANDTSGDLLLVNNLTAVGISDGIATGGSFTGDTNGDLLELKTTTDEALTAKIAAEAARDAALVSETNMAGAITIATANMVEDEQVLTNVPVDALFTDTIYAHPASHSIATITNLQDTLDSLETSHTSLTLDGGYF